MLWQMSEVVRSLLWETGWITRLCSWALVFSSLFYLGQFIGSGIAAVSKPPRIHVPQTTSSGSAFNNSVTSFSSMERKSTSSDAKATIENDGSESWR